MTPWTTPRLGTQSEYNESADMVSPSLSTAHVLKTVAILLFAAVFIWKTLFVDLLIFAGVLLAVFLSRFSGVLARRSGLSYGLSLVLVLLLLSLLIAGSCWLFAQSVLGQFDQLSRLLSSDFAKLPAKLPHFISERLTESLDTARLTGNVDELLGIFSSTVGTLGAIVVVIFFGIYLAIEPPLYRAGLLHLVPPRQRERIGRLFSICTDVIWSWLLGRLFSMTVIGTATAIGLWTLGMPVPIALGLLAGGLALVPYLGAVSAAVPALLLGVTHGPWNVLYVAILYLAIHILEGYILVPLVQRRASHVPPALALASQLIMGVLAGILGIVVAMPLIAVLIPTVKALYVEDVLDDPSSP